MRRFILHWAVVAIALFVAASIVPGVRIATFGTLGVAALVLGLVNATVQPFLTIVTLPITLLTLGFFYLFVNAAAFGLAAWLVDGFEVSSTRSAVVGALVVGFVSWVIGGLGADDGR